MKVTIPVRNPDWRMELWDTRLKEASVMLKIANVADKPKVLKTETELSVNLITVGNPLRSIRIPTGYRNLVNGVVVLKGFLK